MEKSVVIESKEENNVVVLSTELSSLEIGNIVVKSATHQIINKLDIASDCCAESVLAQHESNKENNSYSDESQTENHELAIKGGLESAFDSNLDVSCDDFAPVTGKLRKAKEKHAPRKKVKDYNIVSVRNAIARPPSFFKLDKYTTCLLELLLQHRHVGEYHNVVSKGTNSLVIHANCHGKYHTYFPCGNAVKVYKLNKDEERNKALWKHAQREIDLLYTLSTKHNGNNFPHPVFHNKNIVVMSFIGTDQEPAPSVTTIPSEHIEEMYHSIVKEMDLWYNKLNLVHGNLSTKNVLYWENRLYYIGWSHFVFKDHPKALKKLMRDCQFVTEHFESRDVPVKPTEELFKDITGLDAISSKVLEVIHTKDLWQDQHQTNPNRKTDSATKPSRNFRFK